MASPTDLAARYQHHRVVSVANSSYLTKLPTRIHWGSSRAQWWKLKTVIWAIIYQKANIIIGDRRKTHNNSHFLPRRRPARTGVADRKWAANVTIIGETDQIFNSAKSSTTFPWAVPPQPAATSDHQHGSARNARYFLINSLRVVKILPKTINQVRCWGEKKAFGPCRTLLDALTHTLTIVDWSRLTSAQRLITSSLKNISIKFAAHSSRLKEVSQQ